MDSVLTTSTPALIGLQSRSSITLGQSTSSRPAGDGAEDVDGDKDGDVDEDGGDEDGGDEDGDEDGDSTPVVAGVTVVVGAAVPVSSALPPQAPTMPPRRSMSSIALLFMDPTSTSNQCLPSYPTGAMRHPCRVRTTRAEVTCHAAGASDSTRWTIREPACPRSW
jgi:hypothetical protein